MTDASAPTILLLRHFDTLHRARLGQPAIVTRGKDAAHLATLWRQLGTDTLIGLMEAFFASDDPFILQAGFTVGVFRSQAGKLLTQQALAAPSVPPVPPSASGWWTECQRAHGGTCNGSYHHALKMRMEALGRA